MEELEKEQPKLTSSDKRQISYENAVHPSHAKKNTKDQPLIDLGNDIAQKSKAKTMSFIHKQFRQEPCITCKYQSLCANSGFHIYNHLLKDAPENMKPLISEQTTSNNCPHSAKLLFDHYIKQVPEFNRKILND